MTTSRIYLASSWRNPLQPFFLNLLRAEGHEVYDFRNPPPPGFENGFRWSAIDEHWKYWTPTEYRKALQTETAQRGLDADHAAMTWADTFISLQPFGCSASYEGGWAAGREKRTAVFLTPGQEPDLMFGLADALLTNPREMLNWLKAKDTPRDFRVWRDSNPRHRVLIRGMRSAHDAITDFRQSMGESPVMVRGRVLPDWHAREVWTDAYLPKLPPEPTDGRNYYRSTATIIGIAGEPAHSDVWTLDDTTQRIEKFPASSRLSRSRTNLQVGDTVDLTYQLRMIGTTQKYVPFDFCKD